jgi:hypothetical protein
MEVETQKHWTHPLLRCENLRRYRLSYKLTSLSNGAGYLSTKQICSSNAESADLHQFATRTARSLSHHLCDSTKLQRPGSL